MTLFQEFDFGVNIKYDTGRETVKGMSYNSNAYEKSHIQLQASMCDFSSSRKGTL